MNMVTRILKRREQHTRNTLRSRYGATRVVGIAVLATVAAAAADRALAQGGAPMPDYAEQTFQERQLGQVMAFQERMTMQDHTFSVPQNEAHFRRDDQWHEQRSVNDLRFQLLLMRAAPRAGAKPSERPAKPQHEPVMPRDEYESPGSADPQTPAASDVVKWHPVLQDARFLAQRKAIETPFRRAPRGRGLSTPTASDYRNMAQTVLVMKSTLKELSTEITAAAYFEAEKFLDRLSAEALSRSDQVAAAARR
jgi:hypothetical protein